MKPEFMRPRRAFAAAFVALLVAVGMVALAPALSASAHNNGINATCTGGLNVNLTSYPRHSTVKVVVDGVVKTTGANGVETFYPGWSESYNWDGKVNHTFSVEVFSPDDVDGAKHFTFKKNGALTNCVPPDSPKISVQADACVGFATANGTVSFNLNGVKSGKTYKIELYEQNTKKATKTSTGGSGSFTGLAVGTYKIKASASGVQPVTSSPVTINRCALGTPDIDLNVQTCITDGALGAVNVKIDRLDVGATYHVELHGETGTVLDTLNLTATTTTFTGPLKSQRAGTYYVTISSGAGKVLATSTKATIGVCAANTPKLTVTLEPCSTLGSANEREISVALDGLSTNVAYTVKLIDQSPTAKTPVIAKTTTPAGAATTFTHTFIGVPTGEYKVEVTATNVSVMSDQISAVVCDLVTLAPPTIEAFVDQCEGTDGSQSSLSVLLGDLDTTKTYYVRIVDGAGAIVDGGGDQLVSGLVTTSVAFPDITAPGSYTAQLLIDPDKQLAATDANSVSLDVCLPTLAITGPGVLFPLGSVAALLLTLGGALVTGRLRRRVIL